MINWCCINPLAYKHGSKNSMYPEPSNLNYNNKSKNFYFQVNPMSHKMSTLNCLQADFIHYVTLKQTFNCNLLHTFSYFDIYNRAE